MIDPVQPPIPSDNERRLEALRRYGILDTAPEEAYDGVARLAAYVCRTPIAVINLIDEGRQWFKSEVGLGVRETPLDVSICAHAILQPGLFIVPDTTLDDRFACNPLVVSGPGLRFYAGALLETPDGHALGTLCVLDRVPRGLDEAQRDALLTLARQVMAQMELRRELAAQAAVREELRHSLRRAESASRALAESEARTAAILDASIDAIVTFDQHGLVLGWNPAAERIFGRPLAEAGGRDLCELIIPPAMREAHRSGLARSLETGEGRVLGQRLELSAVRADGSEFPAELSVCRVSTAGPPLFTAHIRDITGRKRAEDALLAAKEEADAANRAKTQFLAVLSHELRTPLNPILLAASSMLDRPTPPEDVRPTLEMIRHNVHLQARLIDDLLDVMRIVRGKMPLHWGVVDCHELIEHAMQVCQGEVVGKSIRPTLDLTAAARRVNADSARLEQVFWNLIKNAVKFTPEGGSITIRTRDEGDEDVRLVVEVSDTGIGIDPDVLPTIWDPFQQGETTITRRFGGLGLGLSICKGIVEAHGGTIEARSGGKHLGTTFRIALPALPDPAAEPDDPTPDEVPGVGPGGEPATLKILIVEDEEATRRLMARLLRGCGHEIATAGTIAEASRIADAGPFDLIISDIGLPDGSGLDLIRRIVETRGQVPSIALTGYGMEEDIVRSRGAGFTAHMTKPIDFSKLEAMIQLVGSPRP